MKKTFLFSLAALALFMGDANAQQVQTKFIADGAVTSAKLASGATGTNIEETPSGTINGTNVDFDLSQTPKASANVSIYLDGALLVQGTDYTISSKDVTMTVAPATGQSLRAKYIY